MDEKNKFISQIKLIRRIIDHGYEKAMNYASTDAEILFTKTLEDKSKTELLDEISNLKQLVASNSNRTSSPYQKFCIGKCQREYAPRNGNIEIYCPSCDRFLNSKPIKNYKDI